MRLNKYIASSGVCSRRKADELIENGDVTVNGNIVNEMGLQIDINIDKVCVGGHVISIEEKKVYIMLNKPKGYITTSDEQFGRPMVLDLINEDVRVFPIGRLDMDTEGMLLLTNDGEFANKLTHPKNKVEKTYIVKHKGRVIPEQLEKLKNGVDIGDYITRPAKVELLPNNQMQIVISEGKNRQVRKMCKAVNIFVMELKRIKIGNIELGNLENGKYRYLTNEELKEINKN